MAISSKLTRDYKGRFMAKRSKRAHILRKKRRNPRRRRRSNPAGFLGIPTWLWLVAGAAAFYFLVIRKQGASALPAGQAAAELVPGAAAAVQAAQGQQGYGGSYGYSSYGLYGRY